jgi:Flp pilus assembly pilin Flp
MVNLTNFLKSEDGAVTVDWVVLTAAIVGLGIVVISSVGGGATDVSNSLGATLENAEPQDANIPIF